ncbi:hypothetical protein SBC1_25870 [Caballeronia sp. SBC1]|nr:hypothetical protein SBC1_25870 [Caballeronia sp. SBC1]
MRAAPHSQCCDKLALHTHTHAHAADISPRTDDRRAGLSPWLSNHGVPEDARPSALWLRVPRQNCVWQCVLREPSCSHSGPCSPAAHCCRSRSLRCRRSVSRRQSRRNHHRCARRSGCMNRLRIGSGFDDWGSAQNDRIRQAVTASSDVDRPLYKDHRSIHLFLIPESGRQDCSTNEQEGQPCGRRPVVAAKVLNRSPCPDRPQNS